MWLYSLILQTIFQIFSTQGYSGSIMAKQIFQNLNRPIEDSLPMADLDSTDKESGEMDFIVSSHETVNYELKL